MDNQAQIAFPGPSPRRRSIHFVPGGNDRMFAKALRSPADALILDLEDSVLPEGKEKARAAVCEWLGEGEFGVRRKLARVNPIDSPWGADDLVAVVACAPDGIVLPKAASAVDVEAADRLISERERQCGLAGNSVKLLLIGTETPAAVFDLPAMARHPRVDGLTWGSEDLSAELGAGATRDDSGEYLDVFRLARSLTLLAATAAGKQPIDTIYADIRDAAGLRKECRRAAAMGFTGKLTIHPDQIDIVNELFTPSREQVAEARELLAAAAEHRRQGRIAFRFKGRMVDAPHLKGARRVLDRAGAATED